jgi:hypothetical protein
MLLQQLSLLPKARPTQLSWQAGEDTTHTNKWFGPPIPSDSRCH